MKVNKADLLKALKQDLSSAKDMKAAIDQRVAERRDIYCRCEHGHEESHNDGAKTCWCSAGWVCRA